MDLSRLKTCRTMPPNGDRFILFPFYAVVMKLVARLFWLLFLFCLLLPVWVGLLTLEPQPALAPLQASSAQDASVAKQVLSQLNKTMFRQEGNTDLTQNDLNALSKIANHAVVGLRVQLSIEQDGITVIMTFAIPKTPWYLNFHAELANVSQGLAIHRMTLGRFPLPSSWARELVDRVWQHFSGRSEAQIFDLILGASQVSYPLLQISAEPFQGQNALKADSIATLKQVVGYVLPEKLVPLQEELNWICQGFSATERISLAQINTGLMQYIAIRAKPEDVLQWNVSAIWILAINFANPRFLRLVDAPDLPIEAANIRDQVTLGGRRDLALHFLYSALLEQLGGESASFAMGELKELNDSAEGGSGFSFADLAADRAGIRYSRYLTQPSSARLAVERLASSADEAVFFPSVHSLQEQLSAQLFTQQYGNTQSGQYQDEIQNIEATIQSLPLYLKH